MTPASYGDCRSCGAPLREVAVDLGMSPLANSYVAADRGAAGEVFYPLRALVCGTCKLVQLEEFEAPAAIFSDYAYFSSYSSSWLAHCARYVDGIVERRGLDAGSFVVELASNDGYLLRNFVRRGIPVLGVEPAANVAAVAEQAGVPTRVDFFGRRVGEELAAGRAADLVVANNVLAHVPDLNDFVAGVAALLAPGGWATFEFPHLLHLVDQVQFDTIYHEHFSYFSLLSVAPVLERHGLHLVDVEELPTHGGSVRIHVAPAGAAAAGPAVAELVARERAAGLDDLATYRDLARRVREDKRHVLQTLFRLKEQGLRIAAYGAPAKGNTLLNYCGIGTDLVDFTVDQSPHKQGTLLPGSRIPVLHPDELAARRPDVVWILPWNLRDEIVAEHGYVQEWGGRFLARTPTLSLLP